MIVRIYTGQDGQTHFEDLPLPAEESHDGSGCRSHTSRRARGGSPAAVQLRRAALMAVW